MAALLYSAYSIATTSLLTWAAVAGIVPPYDCSHLKAPSPLTSFIRTSCTQLNTKNNSKYAKINKFTYSQSDYVVPLHLHCLEVCGRCAVASSAPRLSLGCFATDPRQYTKSIRIIHSYPPYESWSLLRDSKMRGHGTTTIAASTGRRYESNTQHVKTTALLSQGQPVAQEDH